MEKYEKPSMETIEMENDTILTSGNEFNVPIFGGDAEGPAL